MEDTENKDSKEPLAMHRVGQDETQASSHKTDTSSKIVIFMIAVVSLLIFQPKTVVS